MDVEVLTFRTEGKTRPEGKRRSGAAERRGCSFAVRALSIPLEEDSSALFTRVGQS